MKKGYIQVYTGNGKGKTTAALGLALRAALAGFRVFIGQFMKGVKYSELKTAKIPFLKISGGCIDIKQFGTKHFIGKSKGYHGEKPMSDDIIKASHGLKEIKIVLQGKKYDIVIADELNVALYFNLISLKECLSMIDEKPSEVELIITGRYAPPEIIDRADLVTEMKEVKHYYKTQGIKARKGIEF